MAHRQVRTTSPAESTAEVPEIWPAQLGEGIQRTRNSWTDYVRVGLAHVMIKILLCEKARKGNWREVTA